MKRKRFSVLSIILALLISLAGTGSADGRALTKFQKTFYDVFDTVVSVTAFAADEAEFDAAFDAVEQLFIHYHRIFDGYHAYDGIHNLYALNLHAANEPVPVEPELMELLLWVRDHQSLAGDRINIAMGSVLSIWHNYRTEGTAVPSMEELEAAAAHTDPASVILDPEQMTVTFTDENVKLDLGAVAKGFTVEKAAQLMQGLLPSFIINGGGNVYCGNSPEDGRPFWAVGIQTPDVYGQYGDIVYVSGLSVVTSGDYERYYTVDGVRYHHIIDPDTLMPARHMRSVTIVTADSSLADFLSTALFNMPYEQGRELIDSLEGVEAYWILNDGSVSFTDGLAGRLSSQGAVNRP